MKRVKSVNHAVVLVLVWGIFCSAGYGQPWAGSGMEGDPYQIWTAEDMQAIGADPNYWDVHFLLCADIDLSAYTGTSFNIIGNDANAFTGVFDGGGHTISNFTYDSNGVDYIGLFGYIDDPNAVVKNLGLIVPDVNAGSGSHVGSMVGRLKDGTISNCYVEDGLVSGKGWTGGFVGSNSGIIQECYSTAGNNGYRAVGGLVGESSGVLQRCYSMGSVIGESDSVGGLVGINSGDIQVCYSSGSVTGLSGVGGLVGTSGRFSYTVSCYSSCGATGEDAVGGLVGANVHYGGIEECYSTGFVMGDSNIGGLVGYDSDGYFGWSFWDSDVNPDVNGIGNTDDPNVIGLPTVDMQTESNYTDAGWDFVDESLNGDLDIWRLCNGGAEYPHLNWEYPRGDFGCPDGVNFVDFAVLGDAWFSEAGDLRWDAACDISVPADGVIDGLDLAIFAENWLANQ